MAVDIRSSHHSHNMAAWCTEKSQNVVAALVQAIVSARSAGREEINQDLFPTLPFALWDATKLLAFSTGSEWSPNDPWLLLEEGQAGFEKLLVRYGLASEPTDGMTPRTRQTLAESIEALLAGSRAPNRTLLHELVSGRHADSPALRKLVESLEDVTQGRMEWSEFATWARTLIADIKAGN